MVPNYRTGASRAEAEKTASDLSAGGGAVYTLRADVGIAAQVGLLVAGTVERFGGIDAAINNAGRGERVALADPERCLHRAGDEH